MIRIESLEKSFGRLSVLSGVDLVVPDGRVTALVGPNGSGKTTLIQCVLGLVHRDGGLISVGSVDSHRVTIEDNDIANIVFDDSTRSLREDAGEQSIRVTLQIPSGGELARTVSVPLWFHKLA